MKKINFLFAVFLAFLISFVNFQGLAFAATPDYEFIASKSGLVNQEDFAPIELSVKNNTDKPITIGSIDVQRVQLPFEEGTMETISQIPVEILDACRSVLGATDPSGPDGDCINIDGEWYRNTLSEKNNDVLPQPTINPGQTVVVAEISTGMPTSWRGWYGGGWVDLYAWINITPQGEAEQEWAAGFVRHFINEGSQPPNAWFQQDNGDGTATFIVTGIESGLKKENFQIYQRIDDKFAGYIGTIISVTEDETDEDEVMYIIIWRHLVTNHNGVCIAAENNDGENVLDWGDIEMVTITSTLIPRTFETKDGETVTSNIGDIKDLANTEIELTFTMAGFGSISFAPGLNIFDYKEELEKLGEFLLVSYDESSNVMRAAVDTSSLTFLAEHRATIQFFGVSDKMGLDGLTEENFMQLLDISVYDNGEVVGNISDYFDWDDVTYNAETDTLTLPVNHFTEYVLGEATELPETGAAIVLGTTLALLSLTTYAILKRYKFFVN